MAQRTTTHHTLPPPPAPSFLALHEKSGYGFPLPTVWGSALLTYYCDLALILNKNHTNAGESTKALVSHFNECCEKHTPLY